MSSHKITPWATAETLENEHRVKAFLEDLWNVDLCERDTYDPIDWDIVQDGQQMGVIELKSYNRKTFDSPTVFLNIRKFIALRDWHRRNDKPAFYMVNFLDQIRYINVMHVSTAEPIMGGQKDGPRKTDWEPMYLVPVADMKLIATKGN